MIERTSCFIVFMVATMVPAAELEDRSFAIHIDKKLAGNYHLQINTKDDGTQMASMQADVKVKSSIFTYKYSFRGSEAWKDGKVLQVSTSTNDNGKKHTVFVTAMADGLSINANGKETTVNGEPWISTWWRLPSSLTPGPRCLLLDADTGKVLQGKIANMGIEKITLLGTPVNCFHWRIRGDMEADLWFDGTHRLVRQESVEEGHHTLLELTDLKRQ